MKFALEIITIGLSLFLFGAFILAIKLNLVKVKGYFEYLIAFLIYLGFLEISELIVKIAVYFLKK